MSQKNENAEFNNSEKIAVITGATSGFGTVVAEHLIQKGYSLIALGRSEEKLKALKDVLGNIKTQICDLSSLKSVRKASNEIRSLNLKIDLLILNAGLWNFEFVETEDGIEETLQVNLIAPILLCQELQESMRQAKNTKVIFTASGLHQGEINFSDIEFRTKFSGFKAYRQSKLGLIMLTRLFAKQYDSENISFYSVHPGVVNTKLGRNAGWLSRMIFRLIGKTPAKGAKTHLHLIDELSENLISGEYYANAKATNATKESHNLQVAEKLLGTIQSYLK